MAIKMSVKKFQFMIHSENHTDFLTPTQKREIEEAHPEYTLVESDYPYSVPKGYKCYKLVEKSEPVEEVEPETAEDKHAYPYDVCNIYKDIETGEKLSDRELYREYMDFIESGEIDNTTTYFEYRVNCLAFYGGTLVEIG